MTGNSMKHLDNNEPKDNDDPIGEILTLTLKKMLTQPGLTIEQAVSEAHAAITKQIIQAAYKANRDVIREQKKYLQPMTLEDGKTVIQALSVGMMYASANRLAEPLEATLQNQLKEGERNDTI
jgi:hypothetical protein